MMIGYDYKSLLRVAKSRGYLTDRAVGQMVARLLSIGIGAAGRKVFGETRWLFEETFIVASELEMTPREYADTFLSGVFVETREGRFIAYVEDPGRLMYSRREKRKQKEIERLARKEEWLKREAEKGEWT